MELHKHGHACVSVTDGDRRLVIDPGAFSEPTALDGATAVLITHEHADHYVPDLLAGIDAPVFTIAAVADKIREDAPQVYERTTTVAPGQSFEAAGVPVTAVNQLHAVVHPEFPRFDNSGYLVTAGDTTLFHPGDALDGPAQDVDILFVPVSAPWAAAHELVDFARRVKAPTNIAIHDRIYSEAGSAIFDGHINAFLPKEGLAYKRLKDGEDL
jgi:L-ascorbate metabolism protein UlaG (beta-lactamase superfamily)